MTTPIIQLQHMLEPFFPLLEDGTEDIAINRPQEAWVRRYGRWEPFAVPEMDFDALLDMTIMAASITQQETNAHHPLLFTDIPMENGPALRLMAFQPPAVESGTVSWTLRQPSGKIHPIEDMPKRYKLDRWNKWQRRKENKDHTKAIQLFDSGDLTGFLTHIVQHRYNILCCGATGAGKTEAGNTMLSAIPDDDRLVTIENTREYRLTQPNCLHLLYSQGKQGVADVTQEDLQRASLRCRPTRVLVQELLDADAAATYVMEVVSGHPGSITTIHGADAAQAFKRLYGLVSAGSGASSQRPETILTMLESTVDCIIPFTNDRSVFSIGEIFFAPERRLRGETVTTLLDDVT
jgi:type IV secretion system protein VirB11